MTAIFLYKKNKYGYRKKNGRKFAFIISIIFCALLLFLADKKIFESAISQSKFVINNMVSLAISNAVNKIITEENLSSNDFCISNLNNEQTIFANTVLINKFCSELAFRINDEFLKLGPGKINIPIGSIFSSFSGINLFNTLGPCVKIKIIPIGNALIDYQTKFISAGINQTNFQIWLNVKFNSQIVNLIRKKDIIFEKKIPLVNTIINGAVPNAYIDSRKIQD